MYEVLTMRKLKTKPISYGYDNVDNKHTRRCLMSHVVSVLSESGESSGALIIISS